MKTSYKILLGFTSTVVTIIAMTPQYFLWRGDNAEYYRNRKGFFSLNVQAICNAGRMHQKAFSITFRDCVKSPTLKRCTLRDPELDKCLLKATEFAVMKLSKGFSMIGLNSLDPLRNAKLTLSNDRWPVALTLEADRISIIGPSNVHIRSVSFDERTSKYTMQGFHQSLRMVGNYRVRGSILLFPLNSAGTFDMELLGTLANHTLKLTGNVRDATHGQVGLKLLSLNNVIVSLRDPSLGTPANRAINRLVNDNWKIVSRALTSSMEKAIHDIYTSALSPLTSKYTIYDFFPEYADRVNEDYEDENEQDEEAEESVQPVVAYSYFQKWK